MVLKGIIAGLAAATIGTAAFAQNTVELSRAVFVERHSAGNVERKLQPAQEFRKGDTVILVVRWTAHNGSAPFTVSSAIPASLQFQQSSKDGQTVSVDGGKNWGKLGALHKGTGRGKRVASPEDVTHLRWRIPSRLAAKGSGQITYSAIVR